MDYLKIADYYENKFNLHRGDINAEVNWGKDLNANNLRWEAFAEFAKRNNQYCDKSVLDMACGTGSLLYFLGPAEEEMYTGIDINPDMIKEARRRHPDQVFIQQDILAQPLVDRFDIVLANGLFTVKHDLHWTEMVNFTQAILAELWENTNDCLAWNLMDNNKISAEDQRSDLFFVSYDSMINLFLKPLKPSGWKINSTYGYDYIIEVYKN